MPDIKTIIGAVSPYGSDADIDTFIALAQERIDRGDYADRANSATAYLACHLMAVRDRANAAGTGSSTAGGTAGPVTSISEADLSIGYGRSGTSSGRDAGGGTGGYDSTEYGLQFLALRRQALRGPVIGGSS